MRAFLVKLPSSVRYWTVVDLRQELEERTDDLNASRAANRDLMTLANRKPADPG